MSKMDLGVRLAEFGEETRRRGVQNGVRWAYSLREVASETGLTRAMIRSLIRTNQLRTFRLREEMVAAVYVSRLKKSLRRRKR